jgi:DNA-binding transcriptional regulator YdaS (Cro superfamily)
VSFAGDLQKLPLADVIQSIHQNSLSGALAVRNGLGERLVSFDGGMVTGCADIETRHEGDVGDELIRQQRVSPKDVKRGQSRFFKRKGTLRKSLSRRRLLESGEFDQFARRVVLERIYELFLLEEGTFEFLEEYDTERFSDDENSAGIRLQPGEILMEAMRRIDEWGRIRRAIPSFKEVYVAARGPSEDDDEIDAELLRLTLSGTNDLDSVLREVPAPRFLACESVLSLIGNATLRVATAPEYLKLGKAAETNNDLESAADFYERGLHYERGNADLNERLISVLERLGRKDSAASERKVYAGTLLEHGDVDRAASQFAAAARLAPSDPLPLERLLGLEIERERSYDKARETAKKLVALYLRLGLAEKAKGVYPRVLALRPKDRWLRERQAEVHEELNENPTAAAIYKELAQEALKQDNTPEATDLLKRAVLLVPDDSKAGALLEELETGRYRALRRRRRLFWLAMAGLAIVASSAMWGTYEIMALAELRRASRLSMKELHQGVQGALAAVEILDATRQAYPHTRAEGWAHDLIVGLSDHYVELALRSGENVGRNSPPGKPLSSREVSELLAAALDPPKGTSLKALLDQAEVLLDQREATSARNALADTVRPRLDRALQAIRMAGPTARATTAFEIDLERVRDLLPVFQLAWAEASFPHLPAARLRIREARAKLHADRGSAHRAEEARKSSSAKTTKGSKTQGNKTQRSKTQRSKTQRSKTQRAKTQRSKTKGTKTRKRGS